MLLVFFVLLCLVPESTARAHRCLVYAGCYKRDDGRFRPVPGYKAAGNQAAGGGNHGNKADGNHVNKLMRCRELAMKQRRKALAYINILFYTHPVL